MNKKTVWAAVEELLNPDVPNELGSPWLVVFLLFVVLFYIISAMGHLWGWYGTNQSAVTPVATFIGAAVVAWAALRQAKTARLRHEEQTRADILRRITESFTKAAEQLGDDKLSVRLGGIYTMERISLESWRDYWPAMETLCAFVRERSKTRVNKGELDGDVSAALTVLGRRSDEAKRFQDERGMRLDLTGIDLSLATLQGFDLSGANLESANFQMAEVRNCNLAHADLGHADFSAASLARVDCVGARANFTNFKGVVWQSGDGSNMRAERLSLNNATLKGVRLSEARFWRADVRGAIFPQCEMRLDEGVLDGAIADEFTQLPEGVDRPTDWPSAASAEAWKKHNQEMIDSARKRFTRKGEAP
ncbi:Pentapeptide repeats (8 copies) [Caballeronia peredens]|nr:Pentapeptide repeats (8 copies) [Caballeronia peredens]